MTGVAHLDEVLDDRTVEILRRRRATRNVLRRRGWLVRRALLTADVVGLVGAFALAELAYAVHRHQGALSQFVEVATFVVSLPLWVVAIKLYGLYEKDEERADHSTTDDFVRLFHLITVCTFLLYAVSATTRLFHPQFSKLFAFWLIAIAGTTLLRATARGYCRRHVAYLQNAIIVGAGDVGQTVARKLLKHPEYGINVVGFVDEHPKAPVPGLEHLTLLGPQDDLVDLVALLDVERVIFAFSNDDHERTLQAIRELHRCDVQIDVVPRLFDVLSPRIDVHSVEGIVMCGLPSSRLSASSRFLKRSLDIVASLALLALFVPLFAAIATCIAIDSRGPVFFRQTRVGVKARQFRIWKFRTMCIDAESQKRELAHLNKHLAPGGDPRMFKIDGDPRVTRVGSVLRRWSLDELPQLFNVVTGEMSLVGPRPLIMEEARHVQHWATERASLRPGITGLWQVLGRDEIGFDEMVKLDYLYVTTWSLRNDIALLGRTLPVVTRRRSA